MESWWFGYLYRSDGLWTGLFRFASIEQVIGEESALQLIHKLYEISFFYVMDVPEDFEPVCDSVTEDGSKEQLEWIDVEF